MNTLKKLITIGLMLISFSAFAELHTIDAMFSYDDTNKERIFSEEDLLNEKKAFEERGMEVYCWTEGVPKKKFNNHFFNYYIAKKNGMCVLTIQGVYQLTYYMGEADDGYIFTIFTVGLNK